MKKIILLLFLSAFYLGFSNSSINSITSKSWQRCISSSSPVNGLINVKFLNKDEKNYLLFSRVDTRKALQTGVAEVHIFELNFELKDDEKSFYFTDLDENSSYLSNFKLAYSFDRKNRPNLALIRLSDNRKVCDFQAN